MDSFFEKYLQLSNKNQNIIISLGEKQNDYTFDNTVNKKTIPKIIQFINETYKVKKKYYMETVYQHGNEQIIWSEEEVTYSIIQDSDLHMGDKYLLKWRKYHRDSVVIPVYNTYDSVYNKEVLEFLIENSFTCKVFIIDGLHSMDIVFHKPCGAKMVLEFLNKLEVISA